MGYIGHEVLAHGFQLFLFCNIMEGYDGTAQILPHIPQGGEVDLDDPGVFLDHYQLGGNIFFVGPHFLQHRLQLLQYRYFLPGLPQGFLLLEAQHPAGSRIAVDEAAAFVQGQNPVIHVGEDGLDLVFLVGNLPQGLLEAAAEIIKGLPQLANLVGRADGDPLVEVAGGNEGGLLGDLLNGPGYGPGQARPDNSGNDEGNGGGTEEKGADILQGPVNFGQGAGQIDNADGFPAVQDGDGRRHEPLLTDGVPADFLPFDPRQGPAYLRLAPPFPHQVGPALGSAEDNPVAVQDNDLGPRFQAKLPHQAGNVVFLEGFGKIPAEETADKFPLGG